MERQELIENTVAEGKDTADSTSLHRALANYAIQHAGTDADLDPAFEIAATDHMLTSSEQ